uniref:4-hydroxy-tetrahydrodipicolinate reductase n=1 Tax=Erythrolobus australicus TaxID=1077150 RepID=A0A7S1TMD3_9RHOD
MSAAGVSIEMTRSAGDSERFARDSSFAIMVNGLPGAMASEVARVVVERGLTLAPKALTGPSVPASSAKFGEAAVELVAPDSAEDALMDMLAKYPSLICIDYTHPSSANPNAALYARLGVSYIMGTTGGDEAKMRADLTDSAAFALIAPNMGKQIVAFQAAMRIMAEQFPGAFRGYSLKVTESHQSTKADTSGTAKAVVASLNAMGAGPLEVSEIEKLRTASESIGRLGVPEEAVNSGHAFHTYRLESADGTVAFEFKHNVVGRRVYAEGTVDAALFLAERRAASDSQRVFNMIDVLRAGAMR